MAEISSQMESASPDPDYEQIYRNVRVAMCDFYLIDREKVEKLEEVYNETEHLAVPNQTDNNSVQSMQSFLELFASTQMDEWRLETDKALKEGGLVFDYNGSSLSKSHRKEIGEGSTSKVYAGKAIGGVEGIRNHSTSGVLEPVAIKVPIAKIYKKDPSKVEIANSLTENRERLLEEANNLEILKLFQEKFYPDEPLHFPDACKFEVDGETVLVMEMLPEKSKLIVQKMDGKINSTQAFSCLLQHFTALDIAHKAGISINDKKDRDFNYFPEDDRYVVVDWNVTSSATEIDIHSGRTKGDIDLSRGISFFLSWEVLSKKVEEKLNEIKGRLDSKTETIKAIDILNELKSFGTF